MNYPYQNHSPYIHAAMSHAVQAMMSGAPLPPNCVLMAMPLQQAQQMFPQFIINPQQTPYYGPSPYTNNPQTHHISPQQNYNYPIVPYKKSKKKSSQPQPQPPQSQQQQQQQPPPHSNIYNSSSFDSYIRNLSWSRLFDHPIRKNSKQEQASGYTSKKSRSDSSSSSSSSSSTSSTTSDETIRLVNVTNKPSSSNIDSKQQTKGSLPFKYSSEFIPGIGKQQSQKIKSNDVFIIKKQ